MSKMNHFDLGAYIVADYSKSILPQRASFCHAGSSLYSNRRVKHVQTKSDGKRKRDETIV